MENEPFIYGIIHIGSSNLSMRIIQYRGLNDMKVIEEVRKDTSFGEEVFLSHKLSFDSIRKLCRLLNGLKQLLNDYKVTDYVVYATAALREAVNRRSIIDLIHVMTGFKVEVVDMPQEIYFKHFALQYHLHEVNKAQNMKYGNDFLFVDITSGCVGLTIWQKGTLKYQHNIHIGTLRLLETFKLNQRDSVNFPEALSEYIHSVMNPLWSGIRSYHVKYVVFSGREARILASLMNFDLNHGDIVEVPAQMLYDLYDEIGTLSVSLLQQEYGLSASDASSITATIHVYKEILDNVKVDSTLMMGITFVAAASIFYGAVKTKDPALLYMRAQNLELTRSIASSYYYEPAHSRAFELYSHIVFKAIGEKYGLTDRDEFLLRMAIILYQIGKYVNLLGSNRHAYDLVQGTDIFGITDREKDVVACIVYYDHKGFPSDDDEPFRKLTDEMKMVVLKLIAVFRLVRSLDISRHQKMRDVTARIADGTLIIEYDSEEDTSLETWTFDKDKEFFENVFGLEARLERR